MFIPNPLLLGAFLTAALATPAPQARSALLSCLHQAGLSTVSPSSSGFASASAAYNMRFDPQPAAIVYPSSDADTSAAISCAAAHSVPVTARSGGHSYAAYGLGGPTSGFLVVDLSSLKSISLESDGTTAIIGTGNRLGDVAVGIYDQGNRALPHGVCPYVGIGGHAAFGGYGFTSRQWGLTLDRMVGARLVLANGSIVDVSSDEYPDLFWAVRGAAPFFGIATSYTFATLPAPAQTTYFNYDFTSSSTPSSAAAALGALQVYGQTAPAGLGMEMVMGNDLTFSMTGSYIGSAADLQNVLAPLLEQLPTPDEDSTVEELAWIPYLEALGGGNGSLNTSTAPDTTDTFYAKSLIVPASAQLSDTAISDFFNYLADNGPSTDLNWFIEAELYGGAPSAISAVAENATAYGNRDGLLTFQLYASSSNYAPPYPQSGFSFVEGMASALAGNRTDLGYYPNYVDPLLTDAQWHTGYYGTNYPTLLSLKELVDPNYVFAFGQSVGK